MFRFLFALRTIVTFYIDSCLFDKNGNYVGLEAEEI